LSMEISIKRYRERVSLIDDVEFIMPQNPRVEKERRGDKNSVVCVAFAKAAKRERQKIKHDEFCAYVSRSKETRRRRRRRTRAREQPRARYGTRLLYFIALNSILLLAYYNNNNNNNNNNNTF